MSFVSADCAHPTFGPPALFAGGGSGGGAAHSSLTCAHSGAQVGQDIRDVCRESGFDGFLPKPADRAAIAAEMDRLAGPERRRAAAADAAAASAAAVAAAMSAAEPCKPRPAAEFVGAEKAKAPAGRRGSSDAFVGGGPSFVDALDFDTPRPAF